MYMTMEDIQEKYDGQWIYMVNCRKNEHGSIIGGEVLLAAKSQGELYQRMALIEKKRGPSFVGYAGKIPEGVAFL
ncbi:MAG: hypothetical protein FWB71_01120 [Defluviitaleaceae bacterium]|nr:hypothetical protein [Defluviitaleaceae bacterium]